jgi:ubiquitin carboxyl-terminal hydrolase 8
MRVADIKKNAKEAVQRETRGVASSTLIRAARHQYDNGKNYERIGDLPNGLRSFIKSASLAKIAIDSEHAQSGPLQKEINEFMTVCVHFLQQSAKLNILKTQHTWDDLATRVGAVEDKLRAVEKSHSTCVYCLVSQCTSFIST